MEYDDVPYCAAALFPPAVAAAEDDLQGNRSASGKDFAFLQDVAVADAIR